MKKNVKVAAIQTAVTADFGENLIKTGELVEKAARGGAKIICLQELYRSIYFPQYKKYPSQKFAETASGESAKLFSSLAKKYGVIIIVPIFERTDKGYYNSCLVFDDRGKKLPIYRKIHIPFDPMFYEKNYFKKGDSGYRIYKTKFANFAVLICYDQWFPEAARMVTLKGADIIFYPTAIGYIVGQKREDGDWHDSWETVMRGHAIANGVHVVAVNRVGREGKMVFWGQSFVADSFGKILARAGKNDQILTAKVDLSYNKLIREGWGFFRNRRPDTYKL